MDNQEQSGRFADFIPQLKEFIKAETVFGEPYQVGEVTLIPVNSVKVGFGFGGGKQDKHNGQGGGGGVLLTPVAFVVIKAGDVSIHNLSSGTVENVLSRVPDVLDRLMKILHPKEPAENP